MDLYQVHGIPILAHEFRESDFPKLSVMTLLQSAKGRTPFGAAMKIYFGPVALGTGLGLSQWASKLNSCSGEN